MKHLLILASILLLAGCARSADDAHEFSEIRIVPKMNSRSADGLFEPKDVIGLTVGKEGASYIDNLPLTFDGHVFSTAGASWSVDTDMPATLAAYYPYQSDGVPYRFSIATDQRGGCGPSDLLGAFLPGFLPSFYPIELLFYHLFAELDILIDNRSGQPITEVSVGGFIPTAQVDFRTLSAKPVYGTPPSDVLAYCAVPDERYQVVLVPQRNDMTVRIRTEDGVDRMRTIHGAPLAYGESYKLRVALTSDARFELVLDGDIVDWGYAGSIGDDGNGDGTGGGEGSDPSTVLTYEGETYRIETINGKQWMTENLRYAPVGAVPYDDYFYPNDERNSVASLGLLYRYKTAVGGKLPKPNSTTVVQGICPDGWRVPTSAELAELAAVVPRDFFAKAGYYQPLDDYDYPPIFNSSKIYLISSTVLSDGRVNYLRLQGTSTTNIHALPVDRIAASLRCVKD